MGRITVITNHLSASDLNYNVLKELVRAQKEGKEVCWMYENDCVPFVDIPIPKMSVGKMWEDQTNDGTIIATSLESASLIHNLPNMKRKIFYVWNLEFMWNKWDYFNNINIFNSIEVVTRSKSYANIIENYANVKAKIENFNLEKICQTY